MALRIAWGVAGPRYARFRQFARSPAHTLAYGKRILALREPRHLGHNPLGAWMIVTLIALHVGGVIFSSLRHAENLVLAMFTGRQRAPAPGDVE